MSRLILAALLTILGTSLTTEVAHAMGYLDRSDYPSKGGSSGPNSVPELTFGAGGGALVIIAGAAFIVAGRRRRAKKP